MTEEQQMSLVEHLAELRHRLILSLIGIAVGMGIGIWQSEFLLEIIRKPIVPHLGPNGSLVFTGVMDKFMAHLKVGALGGVVMDGRDIGTHVFPHADVKIFMTANPHIRAERRTAELKLKGENWSLNDVLQNLAERDHIDTTRADQPLRQADDAVVLDNSNLSRQEQLEWALQLVDQKLRSRD